MNGFVVVPVPRPGVGQMTPNSENGHCSFISFDHSQSSLRWSSKSQSAGRWVGQLMIYGGNTRDGWLAGTACLFTRNVQKLPRCCLPPLLALVHLRDQNLLGRLGWNWKGEGHLLFGRT